jgi:hypothetical protein
MQPTKTAIEVAVEAWTHVLVVAVSRWQPSPAGRRRRSLSRRAKRAWRTQEEWGHAKQLQKRGGSNDSFRHGGTPSSSQSPLLPCCCTGRLCKKPPAGSTLHAPDSRFQAPLVEVEATASSSHHWPRQLPLLILFSRSPR